MMNDDEQWKHLVVKKQTNRRRPIPKDLDEMSHAICPRARRTDYESENELFIDYDSDYDSDYEYELWVRLLRVLWTIDDCRP